MAKRDYYQVLGVAKNADEATIKKSYKRMAMKYHPDRNKDNKASAEAQFKEIREAYAVLSDKQKRQMYDQFGHDGVNQQGGFGAGGFNTSGFEDIFSDFFGTSNRRQQQRRGADLQYNLDIDLKQAVLGDTVTIRIPKEERCGTCGGSGAKPGTEVQTCPTCNGHGQVQMSQGFFAVQQTCPSCGGQGKKIIHPCPSCRGHGLRQKEKSLSVKIPAGIDDGNRIRLSNEGQASPNGTNGDLYVQVHIKPHHIFKRHHRDLYCEVPISFVTAALGGTIEVPTITSKVKIRIPSGTQTAKLFKVRGKGAPAVRGGGVGDLLVQVKVETPVNLNSKQKDLLKEFNTCCNNDKKHYPEASSFFDKVKSFFD